MSHAHSNLDALPPTDLDRVNALAVKASWDPARLSSQAIRRLLALADSTLESSGCCPACVVQHGETHAMLGLPLLDAAAAAVISLSPATDHAAIAQAQMYFVFCPYCDWFGLPHADEIPALRHMRSLLRQRS